MPNFFYDSSLSSTWGFKGWGQGRRAKKNLSGMFQVRGYVLGAVLKARRLAIKHTEEPHQYSDQNLCKRKDSDSIFQIFEASNKLDQTEAAMNPRPSSVADQVDSDPTSTNLHMKRRVLFWRKYNLLQTPLLLCTKCSVQNQKL